MSSITQNGDTYPGISVFGRGVFTNDENGKTYAGQCKDGYACGLGVLTWSNGDKHYAEHGPDGQVNGRCLERFAGDTWYVLYERRKRKDSAHVYANGCCEYNGEACAPDDPRLLALIALVAPVEVRPAAPAPPPSTRRPLANKQSSDGSAGPFCLRRRWRPPWRPRCSPILHAVRWWLCDTDQQQPHSKARPRSDACTDRFSVVGAREAPSCTLTTAASCTPRAHPGSSVAMPYSSTPSY